MDQREFLKWTGAGALTLFLSGCGNILTRAESASGVVGGGKHMNIVVVTGSPHREGTSDLLADRFIEGAH